MAWFSYASNLINGATPSYAYPPIRYSLDISAPFQTLPAGSLMFQDIESSDFYAVYSQEGSPVTDNGQYAVIYENSSATPPHAVVRSNVKDGKIYFLTAAEHLAGRPINDLYYIYYGNKYLKYVGATPSLPITNYSKITNFRISQYNSSTPLYETEPYNLDISNLEQYMVTVYANQNIAGQENFSYLNANTDWAYFKSSTNGAKTIANFTGPQIKLYAYKQSDGGKIKLNIIKSSRQVIDSSTGLTSLSPEEIVVKDVYIDLYSNTRSVELIYENTALEDAQYYVLMEIVNQDNRLSSGSLVELHTLKYLRNSEINVAEAEVNPVISFRSTGNRIL